VARFFGYKAAARSGSLRDDLRRMLVLVGGAALLLAAVVYAIFQTVMAYFEAVHDLSHRADMIEMTAAEAIVRGGDVGSDLFRGLRGDVELLAGAIYNNDGELVTHFVRDEADSVAPTYQGSLGNSFEGIYLVHARPLHLDQAHVGVLYLRTTPHHIIEQLVWNLLVGLAVVAACFGLAHLASFRLKRRIAQPIENLLETARTAAAEGDYSVRASTTEQSELRELVDLFNHMLNRVEAGNSALKSSSEYFIALVENARDVIFILDEDQRVKFVNAALTRTLAHDKEHFLNRRIDDLIHPDDRRLLKSVLNATMQTNPGALLELRLRDAGGGWREHDVGLTDLRGDPVVQGVVVDCRDISQRLATERERRQTQEFLHTIFETLPIVVFVKDANDLRYLRVNRAVKRVLGYSPKTFVNKRDHELFPKEQAEILAAADHRVLETGQIEDMELSIQSADGELRQMRMRKVPIYHEDGTPRFLLGISEDVTEARRATEAAQVNAAWYRTMMDYAADPVFIHDLEGRFIEVNQRACEALGYSRDELLQMSVPDIDMYAGGDKVWPDWSNLPVGKICTLEGLQLRKDGGRRPVEVRVAAIEVGGTKYVIAISHDISLHLEQQDALTRAMKAAETASEAKSEFLANVNHEMRTPLNAIIGITELLLANSLTSQQRMQIKTIGKSSEVLLELIEEILDYTSMENRAPQAENSEFVVAEVVQDALTVLAERANDKGLELACQVDCSTPQKVVADAGRLRQILINIIGNAIKFTDRGEITVSVSANTRAEGGTELELAVSDTGCGIRAEDQAGIFRPFTQGQGSTERRAGGTGLGLAICKRLVTVMGGSIGVRSSPGKGATFWFRLPVEVVEESTAVRLPEELTEIPALVAISGPRTRRIACDYLRAWGMRPDAVGSLDEVTNKIEHAAEYGEGYGLCLIDAELMTASCAATLDYLTEQAAAAQPKFVVLCKALQARQECARCEITNARKVVKPLGPIGLERALRQTVEAPSQAVPLLRTGANPADSGQYHLLLAEDNPASQATMVQMLTHLGYRSTAVDTGPAVLKALRKQRYDLLLLDCQLPGMDGFEVATSIRAAETFNERLPIVAVSAGATIEQRNRCLAAGMDEYLKKPVRLAQLANLLALRLEANEQPAEARALQGIDTSPSGPLNSDELARLRELDSAFADKLGDIFVQDTRERLARLRDALTRHAAQTVAREAHALKAGCLQVGAVTMVGICEELDQRARGAGLKDAESLLDALAFDFERVRVAIGAGQNQDSPTATH
jgi:PAS domain S-box-containing protein